MRIISGVARNLELAALPDCEIRPTAVRARKALFDSLGSWNGVAVLDLFSGSGALALEAVSRGAAPVMMVENSPRHQECIRENCRRVAATGANGEKLLLDFDALKPERYLDRLPRKPDVTFADPPYAISGQCFRTLMRDPRFGAALSGGKLVWEIPDTPGAQADFMQAEALTDVGFRRFGGTLFLLGKFR